MGRREGGEAAPIQGAKPRARGGGSSSSGSALLARRASERGRARTDPTGTAGRRHGNACSAGAHVLLSPGKSAGLEDAEHRRSPRTVLDANKNSNLRLGCEARRSEGLLRINLDHLGSFSARPNSTHGRFRVRLKRSHHRRDRTHVLGLNGTNALANEPARRVWCDLVFA